MSENKQNKIDNSRFTKDDETSNKERLRKEIEEDVEEYIKDKGTIVVVPNKLET